MIAREDLAPTLALLDLAGAALEEAGYVITARLVEREQERLRLLMECGGKSDAGPFSTPCQSQTQTNSPEVKG